MTLSYTIDPESIAALRKAFETLGSQYGLPETTRVVKRTAAVAASMWQSWAMGGKIEGIKNIKRPSGELAQSIKNESIAPLHSKVSTDSEIAQKVAEGTHEIHMKDLNSPWLRSKRTRMCDSRKHGKHPYLIIPFSWKAPRQGTEGITNVMPINIYNIMKRKERSIVTDGTHKEENVYGDMVSRNEYAWGGRLGKNEADGNDYAEGMVRFNTDSNVTHSTYFTFRILSPYGKADWIIPAVPGVDVPSAIIKVLEPEFTKGVKEAIQTDLEML